MVNSIRRNCFILLIAFISLECIDGKRFFWKGRRDGGNLMPPPVNVSKELLPPDLWFDQKLDHFDANNNAQWKQVSKFVINCLCWGGHSSH